MELTEFVLTHLPAPPARVLEVGSGEGDLARALEAAGYDVTAIDPAAPEGAIFRRIKLEDLDEEERFEAVVASRSFHHLTNLEAALDKAVLHLSGGPFVLDEFGWDLADEATLEWYEGQRRILAASGREVRGPDAADWRAHHEDLGVHRFEPMRAALAARFAELHFSWEPYLYRYLGDPATEALERTLVDAGAVRPIGFRFVGAPR